MAHFIQQYNTHTYPVEIVIRDFNNDRKLDIAVTNYNSNDISVLLGQGDGTFATAVNYPVGTKPVDIGADDINNDGKIDLIVSNYSSNNLSVMLGIGDGTFASAIQYSSGANLRGFAIDDFNADNKLDIVVCSETTDIIIVMLGSGDGVFAQTNTYTVGATPIDLVAVDLNCDGKLDVVTANAGDDNISVLLGKGDGTFDTAVNYANGDNPLDVAIADLNGDGIKDIVSSSHGGVYTFLGIGDGTFASAINTNVINDYLWGVAIADFNGDARLDIATVDRTIPGGSLHVLLRTGGIVPPATGAIGNCIVRPFAFTSPSSTWTSKEPFAKVLVSKGTVKVNDSSLMYIQTFSSSKDIIVFDACKSNIYNGNLSSMIVGFELGKDQLKVECGTKTIMPQDIDILTYKGPSGISATMIVVKNVAAPSSDKVTCNFDGVNNCDVFAIGLKGDYKITANDVLKDIKIVQPATTKAVIKTTKTTKAIKTTTTTTKDKPETTKQLNKKMMQAQDENDDVAPFTLSAITDASLLSLGAKFITSTGIVSIATQDLSYIVAAGNHKDVITFDACQSNVHRGKFTTVIQNFDDKQDKIVLSCAGKKIVQSDVDVFAFEVNGVEKATMIVVNNVAHPDASDNIVCAASGVDNCDIFAIALLGALHTITESDVAYV